jgi:hypothetical protein
MGCRPLQYREEMRTIVGLSSSYVLLRVWTKKAIGVNCRRQRRTGTTGDRRCRRHRGRAITNNDKVGRHAAQAIRIMSLLKILE